MTMIEQIMPIRLTAEQWERLGGEDRYELVEGLLRTVPAEFPRNASATQTLAATLFMAGSSSAGRAFRVIGPVEIETSRAGAEYPTYRITDLTVIRPTASLAGRRIDPADILLVVETVSDSSEQVDYLHKRAEYAWVGIPGYLIVDVRPGREKLTLFRLADDGYRVAAEGQEITLEVASVLVPVTVADLTA